MSILKLKNFIFIIQSFTSKLLACPKVILIILFYVLLLIAYRYVLTIFML